MKVVSGPPDPSHLTIPAGWTVRPPGWTGADQADQAPDATGSGPGAGSGRCVRPPRVGGRSAYLLGWGVTRRYGLSALNPLGNRSLASSSESAGTTMTSSPSFQLTGVATL